MLLGLLPAAPILALSCGQTPVPVGLVMVAPQAIGDADSVDLFVFDAEGHKCGKNGHVDEIPKEAIEFPLSNEGCPEGLSWCADVELEKTSTTKMFAAIAKSQGQTLLEGCTETAIDQDPLEVTIEMKQFIEEKCCGDGKLQPGEQCDPGGSPQCGGVVEDELCFPDCSATEVLLSAQGTVKPLLTNEPHTKSELAMAFCPGNSQIGNALRTVFRSTDSKANAASDINLRVLSTELRTIVVPQPLGLQMRLPMPCFNVYATAGKADEVTPSIAPVSQNSTLMVYASNEKQLSSSDIFLVEHTEDVCADVPQGVEPAVLVSIPTSMPGSVTPDVARGPEGQALIVWKLKDQIVGRVWKGGTMVPPASDPPIPIGTGSAPRVAGSATGWVVVYEGAGAGDGDGILKRPVGLDGKVGTEDVVNAETPGAQIQPDVAMLDDGAYVVVWQNAGNIFFQRYDAAGVAVKGDQEAALNNDKPGAHATPAVGAPVSGGGFFAAAWENDDGSVSARFIAEKSGFLFNSVDGTNASFLASHPGIAGLRRRPAVAIGGYVAIGWQDDSDLHGGVFVRRFPTPN